MTVAKKIGLTLALLACASCSQMIGAKYDTPCDNEPLNALRHRLNHEHSGVRMAELPIDVIAAKREILISIAADKAKFGDMSPEEAERYVAYWREYIPDPFFNMHFYESIDMRKCALVPLARDGARQRPWKFSLPGR